MGENDVDHTIKIKNCWSGTAKCNLCRCQLLPCPVSSPAASALRGHELDV
jgi:hypothetical protein